MRNNIWNRKFPTLLGLIVLIIGVAVTSFLTQSGVIFTSKANLAHTPENIRITNVTDTSFTVTFITSDKVPGVLSYGKDKNLSQTAVDDRNQQKDSLTPYNLHSITVKNLTPSTAYYFSITSGSDTFLNNGGLFEIKTAPQITNSTPTTATPLSGKIITTEGTPPQEAIVYVTTQDAQTLSTIVKDNGTYTLPVNAIRTKNLLSYIPITENSLLQILVSAPSSQSNVSVRADQTNPIPLITISLDYDFTTTISPIATSSARIGFPSFSATSTSSSAPQITSPKKDEALRDQRPVFRGTAQPNSDVTIEIHSDEQIEDKTQTDSRGQWTYRPSKSLTPGQHTITVTSRDQFGILKTITQSFTIYASGSQVNQTATPSATLAPTVRATATPSPTQRPTQAPSPIATKTPTPTVGITGSQNPTSTISPTPSPTIIVSNPISPTVQPTRNPSPVADPGASSTTVGIGAIVTTLSGIFLYFISSGFSSL